MTGRNPSNSPHLWVVGGGAMQVPVVEEARKLDLAVICSDRDPTCECAAIADVFVEVDIFDVEGHIQAARNLRASGIHIVGVLAAGIDAPVTMARLAQDLGLPGVDPTIAEVVNNKALFRRRLSELGFPVPRFVEVTEDLLADAEVLATQVGYPLIVKNTDSSGSRGARILEGPDSEVLREALVDSIAVSRSRTALIESLWDGPEQTVETIFDTSGDFHRCFITDRIFDKGDGFALEIGLRHPSALSDIVQEEMYQIAESVARALGITIGAAKFDFMLTPEGPRIIEMTVRLSGGFDSQYLVPGATGKNVIRAAILTAIGQKFDPALLQDRLGKVGLSRSLWPPPGRIVAVEGLDDARAIAGVERIVMRAQPGDQVEPYVDCTKRTCFIIVSGTDEAHAQATIDEVSSVLRIITEEA